MLKQNSITDKGFFSFDVMIAATILLFFLLFSAGTFSARIAILGDRIERQEMENFSETLAEAIVKNRNEEMPVIGSAYFDTGKRRVMSNKIDESLLQKTERTDFGEYYLASIYEKSKESKFYFNEQKGNCISQERKVTIKGFFEREAYLGVTLCRKD